MATKGALGGPYSGALSDTIAAHTTLATESAVDKHRRGAPPPPPHRRKATTAARLADAVRMTRRQAPRGW